MQSRITCVKCLVNRELSQGRKSPLGLCGTRFASRCYIFLCSFRSRCISGGVFLCKKSSIEVGPYIRIGFSGIPNRIIEFLFGPIVGSIFGGMLDILKYLVKPSGPFFFGFTFDAMLASVIYGSFLYKKPVKLWRIALAELITKLIVNCFFNTLWISMLYGKGFFVLLPARIIKNAVMLPLDTMILFLALTMLKKIPTLIHTKHE